MEGGWPRGHLHIPNNSPADIAAIRAALGRRKWSQVNVYGLSSSQFLTHPCVKAWAPISPGEQGAAAVQWQEWFDRLLQMPRCEQQRELSRDIERWREEAGERVYAEVAPRVARGRFSLVYLDYTRPCSRPSDVRSLLFGNILTNGVLAVTCPARTHGVPSERDRHIIAEREHRIRLTSQGEELCSVGLGTDFPLAGLFKLFFELSGCSFVLRDSFSYRGQGRRTHMWFAVFTVQIGQVMPNGMQSKYFEQELIALLSERACSRPPPLRYIAQVEDVSWTEVQRLSRLRYPCLTSLVAVIGSVLAHSFEPV